MKAMLAKVISDNSCEVGSSSSHTSTGRNEGELEEKGKGEEKGNGKTKEEQILIPGISNELTIDRILTKVSWRTLYVLQSINSAWSSAINFRKIYDARVRSKSTQSLVGLIHRTPCPAPAEASLDNLYSRTMDHDDTTAPVPWWSQFAISLHDPLENSWHQLPPVPHVRGGIPIRCGCVFLKGRLYILGGDDYNNSRTRNEVYMFDLVAGRGQWERCASMLSRRSDFPCGIIGGRIHVSGGSAGLEAEVYDPEEDVWLPIANLLHLRTNHTMVAMDEELFVLGVAVRFETEEDEDEGNVDIYIDAESAEVYDPTKNQWREVQNVLTGQGDHTIVVVDGKLYDFRHHAVDVAVYDVPLNSWTLSQRISWEVLECMGASGRACCALAATAVDGQLFALVRWQTNFYEKLSLLKSKNFGNQDCSVTWEGVLCPYKIDLNWPFLFTINL